MPIPTANPVPTLSRLTLLAFLLALVPFAGWARMPDTGVTSVSPKDIAELRQTLLGEKPDFELFRLRGPFRVSVQKDVEIRLSRTERVIADLYRADVPDKAPLVVLLHGHENSKADHAYQALHIATWGMHVLAVQLPNKGPWLANGKALARLARQVAQRPNDLDSHIDPARIVLAGHSFGGAAVAVALAEGAPVIGAVLLDPAAQTRTFINYLRRVRKPVLAIMADGNVTYARNRDYFFEYIRSDVAEVSITGAHHEDAQFAMDPAPLATVGGPVGEDMQLAFASALTSAAFSLGFTGGLDYAWASFGEAIRSGKLFDALRK